MSLPFKFKEFTVAHDRCAMKIGTDGVLLGAWVSLEHEPDSILDLGTGTGVIALQLAQRSTANTIDAVEIDANAFEQCMENFENSLWGDRLFCYHASAQEFATEIDEAYNLIISNPPFYQEDYKSKTEARDIARFTHSLPFDHLIHCVQNIMADDGIFALVLPFKEELSFIGMASKAGLFPKRICRVRGTISSKTVRSLIEFSFRSSTPKEEELIIETSRHDYTEDYVNLVKDFYLKM